MAFDLDERRVAMWSVFTTPARSTAESRGDRMTDVIPSVIDAETIYTGALGEDNEWVAMPGSGLPGTQLGLLFWLLGAVAAEPADQADAAAVGAGHGRSTWSGYRVEVDPARAVQRADVRDRASLTAAFTEVGIDLAADRPTLMVAIDGTGLIRAVDTALPAPADDPVGLTSIRLELRDLGRPVSIRLPDHPHRMTVEQFVRSMVPEPDVEKFRRWFAQ